MDKNNKNRLLYKIISIILAIILWTYVLGEVNPETERTLSKVSVTTINSEILEENNLTVTDADNITISVLIKGRRGDISGISAADIVAKIDLSECKNGINEVPINVAVPEGATSAEPKPSFIAVKVEKIVSVEKPVKVSATDALPENYEIGMVSLEPENIKVKGAENLVKKAVCLSAVIDIDKNTKVFSDIVPVKIIDSAGEEIKNLIPEYNFVKVDAKLLLVKEVQIYTELIGKAPQGIAITADIPKTIKVRGTEAAIADLEFIIAEPIDLSKISQSTQMNLNLKIPEGIEFADGQEIPIAKFAVEKVHQNSFSFLPDEIEIIGLNEKMRAVFDKNIEIKVTVTGTEAEVSSVSKQDIKLSIDLSQTTAESAEIALKGTTSKSIKALSIQPEKINVRIVKKGD